MGKVTVTTNSKENFKPIKIEITLEITSLKEYNEYRDSIEVILADFTPDSFLFCEMLETMNNTLS